MEYRFAVVAPAVHVIPIAEDDLPYCAAQQSGVPNRAVAKQVQGSLG